MRAHIHFDRQGWPQRINNYLALDGYALGAYGLMPLLLSARWAQLTGTEDYANF
jgi:hypothetical protein